MFAPQFTIRRLMIWTTLVALFSLVATYAVRGNTFATAVCWALLLALVTILLCGWMFLMASAVGGGFRQLSRLSRSSRNGYSDENSPFAEHRAPPRMVRPEEPS